MIVLDASALLAYLFREQGYDIVERYIEQSCISTVNLSEVAGRFVRDGIDAEPLIYQIEQTAIKIVPFTQAHALHAANFIAQTQRYGLSLGDRACLGLAKEKHLAVLTADTAWSQLADIEVVQIRNS